MRFTYEQVKQAIEEHGDTLISTEYQNYRQKLEIHCHMCNKDYKQTFQAIQKGYWCTEDCKRNNIANKVIHSGYKFYTLDDVKNHISQQGDTLLSNQYTNGQEDLSIKCGNCNNTFKMGYYRYNILKQRCPSCQLKNRSLSEEEFTVYTQERGDKLISEYNNSRSKVTIECKDCKKEFTIKANSYRQGGGCTECAIRERRQSRLVLVQKEVGKFGDKLLSTEYINTDTPLDIQCGLCGSMFHKKFSKSYIPSCNVCNSTSLEKLMHTYLINKNYEYKSEHTFDDCRSKLKKLFRFDFYIPSENLIVEMDGIQHHQVVKKFGVEWFDVIQERDIIKTQYCIDNNIKLIRICAKDSRNTELIDELFKRVQTENIVYSDNEMYDYITKAI